MKSKSCILVLVLAISGCDSSVFDTPIERAVRSKLKDPDSAIFKDELIVQNRACISVNAKNSYGGYSGSTYAHLINRGNNLWFVETLDGGTCDTSVLNEMLALDKQNEGHELTVIETLKSHKIIDNSIKEIWEIEDHKCRNFAIKVKAYLRASNSSKVAKDKILYDNKAKEALSVAIATGSCPENP